MLIFSPPRSGSYLLCRLLLDAGLGVPHEYFNETHITLIGQRSGVPGLHDPRLLRGDGRLLLRYLHHLYATRTRNGVFAAKIQYRQFNDFLRGSVGQELFDRAALVYLRREDVVAQAVSLHLAELSGRWSFEATRLTPPLEDRDAWDTAAIEEKIRQLREEETGWELLFAELGREPLRITYEALARAQGETVVQVAEHSGIAAESLNPSHDDEGRYPVDPGLPDKDALAERFRRQHPALAVPAPGHAPRH